MTLLIAQDPGKMTGIATWDTRTETFESFEFTVPEYFDWIHNTVHAANAEGEKIILISESFIITVQTAKNTAAYWSLELIGVMKFLAHRYGLDMVTLQTPAVAKRFMNDQKLKHVGWFKKGTAGHANDAARHLGTYAAQRKLIFDTNTLMELAIG